MGDQAGICSLFFFIHMCIQCLGHFSPLQASVLSPEFPNGVGVHTYLTLAQMHTTNTLCKPE
jgi:hypothetical protein